MIRPLDDRVLVMLPPRQEQLERPSGLILVRDPDAVVDTRGIVVALGHKRNVVDLDDVRSELHTWFVEHDGGNFGIRKIGDDVDRILMQMQPAGFDVQVGDCVIFAASAGQSFTLDGIEYVSLREGEILGIVEPKAKEVA